MSNLRAWISASISALASLCLGAVLLWLLLPVSYPDWADSVRDSAPVDLDRQDFEPVLAAALMQGIQDNSLPRPARTDMMMRSYPRLEAAAYPQLELELSGVRADSDIFVFWRNAETPDTLAYQRLESVSPGGSWHTLGSNEAWRGEIIELAVGAFDERSRGALAVEAARFRGASRAAMFERLWWHWTRFESWQMSSINVYRGVGEGAPLRPGAATAAWAALSLPILALIAWRLRWPRRVWLVACLVVLFLPWFGLDRLWQGQLETQLEHTRAQFGGYGQAQKHAREMDADLQRYAQRLGRLLPDDPRQRIFLLHESTGHNYWRLRLQYHLLPRNVFNFGRSLQPQEFLRAGDFVLVLGEINGLDFHRDGRLDDGEHAVAAERIDSHPSGTLYRVRPQNAAGAR